MKNLVVFFLVILLFLLSGCQRGTGSLSSEFSETSNLAVVTADIGKTLDDLQRQNPSYEYLHLNGYDFSAESLGSPGGTFAYVFFGTQVGPGLEEMAPRYGKQLKCAGIYTTVEKIFSITNNGAVSIEEFLLSIGINIKDSDRVTFWAGWIIFDYMNYSMAINTKDIGSDVYARPTVKIEKSFPLIIKDEELWASNYELCTKTGDGSVS